MANGWRKRGSLSSWIGAGGTEPWLSRKSRPSSVRTPSYSLLAAAADADAAAEEAAVAPVVDEPAASCTYTEDEILGWKVKELKAALKGAGLPVSGLKKVLQQRALENLL